MNIEFKLRLAIFTLLTIWVSAYSQDNSLNGVWVLGKVTIFGKTISIPFIPAPLQADYKIKDNILFIEQRVTFPYTEHPDSETHIVLTKYIKK